MPPDASDNPPRLPRLRLSKEKVKELASDLNDILKVVIKAVKKEKRKQEKEKLKQDEHNNAPSTSTWGTEAHADVNENSGDRVANLMGEGSLGENGLESTNNQNDEGAGDASDILNKLDDMIGSISEPGNNVDEDCGLNDDNNILNQLDDFINSNNTPAKEDVQDKVNGNLDDVAKENSCKVNSTEKIADAEDQIRPNNVENEKDKVPVSPEEIRDDNVVVSKFFAATSVVVSRASESKEYRVEPQKEPLDLKLTSNNIVSTTNPDDTDKPIKISEKNKDEQVNKRVIGKKTDEIVHKSNSVNSNLLENLHVPPELTITVGKPAVNTKKETVAPSLSIEIFNNETKATQNLSIICKTSANIAHSQIQNNTTVKTKNTSMENLSNALLNSNATLHENVSHLSTIDHLSTGKPYPDSRHNHQKTHTVSALAHTSTTVLSSDRPLQSHVSKADLSITGSNLDSRPAISKNRPSAAKSSTVRPNFDSITPSGVISPQRGPRTLPTPQSTSYLHQDSSTRSLKRKSAPSSSQSNSWASNVSAANSSNIFAKVPKLTSQTPSPTLPQPNKLSSAKAPKRISTPWPSQSTPNEVTAPNASKSTPKISKSTSQPQSTSSQSRQVTSSNSSSNLNRSRPSLPNQPANIQELFPPSILSHPNFNLQHFSNFLANLQNFGIQPSAAPFTNQNFNPLNLPNLPFLNLLDFGLPPSVRSPRDLTRPRFAPDDGKSPNNGAPLQKRKK